MNKRQHFWFSILFLVLCSYGLQAQFVEDALRLAEPATTVSARSAAIGNAFIGVADDFSALYWNPAGIGQLRSSEFTLGLSNINVSNKATFLQNPITYDNSNTYLNNIGFAMPFPVVRGSLVFAGGYNRIVNYTNALSFDAYNSQSSIQPSLYDNDVDFDLAWNLWLEDSTGYIPIKNNVHQVGDVTERGNLGQWTFGGSMEIAKNLLAGISLNVLTGSYRWEQSLTETDPNGMHQGNLAGKSGFYSMTVTDVVDQDISGWSAKFGMLYTFLNDKARFGLTIRTPEFLTVQEDYSREGESFFQNFATRYATPRIHTTYDVNTTWIFGLGASFKPLPFATISGDVDLTDFSQIEFDNPKSIFRDLNKKITDILRATNNFRFGAEVNIPKTGVYLRGGFGYKFSPYKDDPAEFDAKIISFGVGYLFENSFLLNATYVQSTYQTFRFLYNDPDMSVPDTAMKTNEDIKRTLLMFSFSYFF